MKTTLLLLSLVITTETLCAQGTVFFGNNAATIVTNRVTHQKLVAGDSFTVELWYAPDNGSPLPDARLAPIAGARTGIKPIAGFFSGGTVTTPDTTAPANTATTKSRSISELSGEMDAKSTVPIYCNSRMRIFRK